MPKKHVLLLLMLMAPIFPACGQDPAAPSKLSIPLGGQQTDLSDQRKASPAPAAEAETSPAMPAVAAPSDAESTGVGVAKYFGKKFSAGPRSKPRICLTFDDGPHPSTTPKVIEILEKHNVKATFFMLGQMAQQNPGTAKLVADAGMEIANHSQTHANLNKLGEEGVRNEIMGAVARVVETTGQPQRLFRPPYGNINRHVTKIAADNGLVLCLWSIDTRDWGPGATPAKITATTLNEARNGSVILLHDIHSRTVEALPGIIEGLKAKGFEFVTMGEMIEAAALEPPAPDTGAAAFDPAPPPPLSISLDQSSKF